jgi:hypothetical protein
MGLTAASTFQLSLAVVPALWTRRTRGAEEAGGTTINMNISLLFEQYPNEYISDGLAF